MSILALAGYTRTFVRNTPFKTGITTLWSKMCSTHAGASGGKIQPQRQVLPTEVAPQHYRVFLDPDLAKYTFAGTVEIDLAAREATNKVSVNILDLAIKSAKLNGEEAVRSSEDKDAQSITWEFPTALKPESQAVLRVEFDGELNDKLCGFYRSVDKHENGDEEIAAVTQMEPADCRRAFPCFDEPALKATFDISIAADPKLVVLSNSDVKSVEPVNSGKQITHFNTTPKMSTYLVAFAVANMKYVESKHFRVPVRVYAAPGQEHRCQYAADLAAKTLAFFEEAFGIEYPLPKCDMIGVSDFSAGAMENWGLITYRLTDLFFTEGQDPASSKLRVTEVIQHELAHQWFGNLVTMEWWDGLWLNEGFATWMSWYACNHFFPGWKVWETYVNDTYQGCLSLDGQRSSHPVQVPVGRVDEVVQIFDAISYLKGASVIRMVSQFLGEDVFMRGISLYLSRHKFGNTVTDDLWAALSEASGKDVQKFMDVWTKEVGYPLVTISEQSSGATSVEATQHRFLATGDAKPEEDKTIYPLYLGVRKSDGSVDHSQVLDARTGQIEVGEGDFFKVNADQNGIFRVKYSNAAMERLAVEGAKGANSKLSVEDRIGLLSDLKALAGIEVSSEQLLNVCEQWAHDTEPNVLSAVLTSVAYVAGKLRFQPQNFKDDYKKFRRGIVSPLVNKYGVEFPEAEDIRLTTLKTQLFRSAIVVEDQKCIDFALKTFAERKFQVEPNLQSGVYVAVAKYGTPEQWEELLKHYLAGASSSSTNALRALGSSKDLARKSEVLDKVLSQTIRSQDSFMAVAGVASSAEGVELAWKWLTSNWEKIVEVFPPYGTFLGYIIRSIVNSFTTQQQLDEVEKFFASKNVAGVDRYIDQAKDEVRAAIVFLEKDLENVKTFIEKHQ